MPKFAANLSMLFTEVPFLDRFERAAAAGFNAVEFLFPYDFATADIQARLKANGLKLVLHNLPGEGSFHERMQRAELQYLFSSGAAQQALAENYVGLPY